jgi:broad-specificity NMP kinase
VKIFIFGAPGAGKTTFSWHLKRRLNSPLLEADKLRVGILESGCVPTAVPTYRCGAADGQADGPLSCSTRFEN